MRLVTLLLLAIAIFGGPAAAKDKPTRFWNLIGDTVTEFRLAPTGTDAFGVDQCANDRDGTVDYDERLKITGVPSGRYDARLKTKHGLACTVRNIEIVEGDIFSIEEKEIAHCHP